MKKAMSISSVVLILVGFIIGLVVSQSSSRFVQEAEAAENTITPALKH
ncbi:MAG: hypothetical protein ACYSTO_10670 [Planctomycetota bacterium]|jgi:hypothetical protein